MATAAASSSSGGSATKGKSLKRTLSHAAENDDSIKASSKSRNTSMAEETSQPKRRKTSVQNNGVSKLKLEPQDEIKQEKPEGLLTLDWTTDELTNLIQNLGSQIPKVDKGKYSTALEKIDWSKISFANHDKDECKRKWGQVMTKVRRFRTLTELVEDAKEWVKHPWMTFGSKTKNKHPDMPKKPLTPYFRYFLERREKTSKEHPKMSMTELAKLLAKKYSELPEKKKLKYKVSYTEDNEEYKIQMEKFKLEHPDMFPDDHRSGGRSSHKQSGGPQKPQTPIQIFMAEKMTKHTNLDPAEKKEYEEKYREQWRSFPTGKRVKFIKKAIQSEEQYAMELAQYCLENPDFKPEAVKPNITKSEKEILDRSNGKPQKPPNSGYSLFSKIMLKQIKDIPSKEKMAEISRRWKEMTEKEKFSYAKQVTDASEKYQKDYATYLENLTEDERKKLEDGKVRKKKGGVQNVAQKTNEEMREQGNARPKKPMSALFFYNQEKMPAYRAKHPEKSEQEITRHLVREFGDLSDKKKEKYKKMAEEAKKSVVISPIKYEGKKSKLFKGEPKKPPQSGYLLYTTELIAKLVNLEPKQRMGEISRQWRSLDPSDQDIYKKKAAALLKKYNKEMIKFFNGLSDEDRKLYEQTRMKKAGGTSTPKATNPTPKKAKTTVAVSVGDSSNEADSDKDDNESSNGSRSKSDESSDDESDRSESGSDSRSDSDSSSNTDSDNTKDSSGSSSDDSDSNDESGSDSESGSGSDK